MKVLIVVTHLLGTGHLARALTLGRAYVAAGNHVTVASGGMPAPHLDQGGMTFVQLPPVRSHGVNFTTLLDRDGAVVNEEYMQSRITMLTDALNQNPPDILITELYPFGRRVLRTEFDALLDAAHALPRRPLICASIRDILAPPSKPAKADRAAAIIAKFYDTVLVHSIEAVAPLSASWPLTPDLATKLQYTGFVTHPPARPNTKAPGKDAIIVSAGGGDVGAAIFDVACKAAALMPEQKWMMLVGGKDPANSAKAWAGTAPANMTVSPARPDFRQMLLHARASVSMCGYNTALDVLQSGIPAVFIPFDAGSEVEQTLRAKALINQPAFALLANDDLTPEALVARIKHVLGMPARAPVTDGMDGAAETVRLTASMRAAMT